MAKNQRDLAEWCLNKAEEYLESAKYNLEEERFYPAAEEIFRAVETVLEAMLYSQGVKEIRYPGKDRPFKGRLALQFLVRDNLRSKNIISKEESEKYLGIETELHSAGYQYGAAFDENMLKEYIGFAETLFFKAKSLPSASG